MSRPFVDVDYGPSLSLVKDVERKPGSYLLRNNRLLSVMQDTKAPPESDGNDSSIFVTQLAHNVTT